MSYNNTGIPVAAQFNLRSSSPLVSRLVIDNAAQWRAMFEEGAVYPSMMFALTADIEVDGTSYQRGFYRITMDGTPYFIEDVDRKITVAEVNALFDEGGA